MEEDPVLLNLVETTIYIRKNVKVPAVYLYKKTVEGP